MRGAKNGRALLVELLIVVLFFGLGVTVVLESMAAVNTSVKRAEVKRHALYEVQEDAARLMKAAWFETALKGIGYEYTDGAWYLERGELIYEVEIETIGTAAGAIENALISAHYEGKQLLEIECAHYIAGGDVG